MDYPKKLKLRFRVGDLDLPERRDIVPVVGRRRTWLQIDARVAQQQSRPHVVGECEIKYKEEWDALEEGMMKLYVCEM